MQTLLAWERTWSSWPSNGCKSWSLKVWRFVCFFSSVVGLHCYTFISSLDHLFAKWTWWKILLYIIFSFFICLVTLFTKARSSSPRLEAHVAIFILMITFVYSIFSDKEVKRTHDAYSDSNSPLQPITQEPRTDEHQRPTRKSARSHTRPTYLHDYEWGC